MSRAQVGRVAGVGGDPCLGAALVAGHVLDRGPAHASSPSPNTHGSGRPVRPCGPVEDYATGHGAGSVGHAKVSCSFARCGDLTGWPGRGMAVPQARHLCQQIRTVASPGPRALTAR